MLAARGRHAACAEPNRGVESQVGRSDLGGPLGAFVEASQDAVFASSLDGRITLWSPSAAHIFGFPADEAVGQPEAMLVPEDLRAEHRDFWRRVADGESALGAEVVRQAKGGRRMEMRLSASPVRRADGTITGVLQTARDLTGWRQGEIDRARLAAIVDSSDDAIISKTLQGIVTSWNRGAEAIFGYRADEMVGKSIRTIIPPERQAEEAHVIARISRGEAVDHFETIRLRKDGSRVDISLTVSPIRDDIGRIVGASKIARDITLRRELERQQLALYDEARQANRAKDEFLAMLGHELRNPLGAITSAAHLLGHAAVQRPEATSMARDVIDRQARHLARLVDDLLDVGRVITGKIVLHRQPLDLADAVARSVRALRAISRLEQHDVSVHSAPIWVDADAVRIEQIIENLLTNALKYTPPGGRIRIGVRRDGRDALLEVEDTGVGIRPELLPRIFDLFAQGDQRVDRARGGLGIGLTLVKRLAELHGGTVQAASNGVGQGSRFAVRLREIASPPGARPEVDRDARASEAAPRRVLLVEDNPDARHMMRYLLERSGHLVYEEADGLRGIESAVRLIPDVALVDIGLPGLDGYSVARQIRQRLGGAIRLVAITGYGGAGDRERAAGAGFDLYVVKPIQPDALDEIVGAPRGA